MTDYSWIGYVVGVIGAVIGIAGLLRNNKSDIAAQSRWMGKMEEKLDNIEAGLKCLTGTPQRFDNVEGRVASVEKRLDRLEERLSNEGR